MLFRRRRKKKSFYGNKLESANLIHKIYVKGWEKDSRKLKDLKKKYEDNSIFGAWVDKQLERIK